MASLLIEIFLKQQKLQYLGRSKDFPVQKTIKSAYRKIKLPRKWIEDLRTINRNIDLAHWKEMCSEHQIKKKQIDMGKVIAYQEWAKS